MSTWVTFKFDTKHPGKYDFVTMLIRQSVNLST